VIFCLLLVHFRPSIDERGVKKLLACNTKYAKYIRNHYPSSIKYKTVQHK